MEILWSLVLGVVQGLTEFLPVSSSGHLVIFQSLISGFEQPGVLFDVVLHMGTLFAVIYFFRNKIFTLARKYYFLLIIGTIPAALAGYFFQDSLETMFTDVKAVGVQLIITGILNFLIDRAHAEKRKISAGNSFTIGIAQAISIIPGISRSGATIFTGVVSGISRREAAEFSFLLSIPAIVGANILQFITHGTGSLSNPVFYLTGFTAAFITGLLSISIVFAMLDKKRFKLFGYYCFAAGLFAMLL